MALALQAYLDECEKDDEIRCIHITGAGKGFCSGQDLSEAMNPTPEEFERMHKTLTQSLQSFLARPGHKIQVFFRHDKDTVTRDLEAILAPARQTARQLELSLDDLFSERLFFIYMYVGMYVCM